jgi:hypothetical protein
MNRKNTIFLVIWFAFCTPFALFGLYALSQAWRLARAGPGAPTFWYPLIFGVVFSSVGFGLMSLVFLGKRRYARQQRLEAEHPNEPWLWRADWAQGHVKSKAPGAMAVGWFATIVFNLASLPIYWAVLHGAMPRNQPLAYIMLAFPNGRAGSASSVYPSDRCILQIRNKLLQHGERAGCDRARAERQHRGLFSRTPPITACTCACRAFTG